MYSTYLTLLSLLLLFSCQEERSSTTFKDNNHSEISYSKKEKKIVDTIKSVFVSNVYGLKLYSAPDTLTRLNIKTNRTEYLDKYDEVFSLKEYQDWYAIKKSIRYKETIDDATQYKKIDCVYVQKKDIGIVGKDKLSKNNLSLVSEYSNNISTIRTGRNKPIDIDSLLSMEIISDSEFNALPTISYSFISKKSVDYRKEGKLVLPIDSNKVVEFKDFPSTEGGCSDTFYKYYGEIEKVNSYLIGSMSCDVYIYTLIDKDTDRYYFEDFPFLSPKSNYLVSVATIGYKYDTHLTICYIDNGAIKRYATFYFFSWVVNEQNIKIKWIDANTFVLRAVHPLYLWKEQEETFTQYIKIEIKK